MLSASRSSMRVFQKRMLSGNPSRSRGPGKSSRKKSASWASKERSPLGTIRTGAPSESDVVPAVHELPALTGVVGVVVGAAEQNEIGIVMTEARRIEIGFVQRTLIWTKRSPCPVGFAPVQAFLGH